MAQTCNADHLFRGEETRQLRTTDARLGLCPGAVQAGSKLGEGRPSPGQGNLENPGHPTIKCRKAFLERWR